jgi:hypothetical protein
MGVLMSWMEAGMASCAIRILRYSWEAMESGIAVESMAGRLKEPKMVRPSRRRKAEYVARGMRVRPIERAVLGRELSGFGDVVDEDEDEDGDGDAVEGDADADADVDAEADTDADAGVDGEGAVVDGGEGGGALFL